MTTVGIGGRDRGPHWRLAAYLLVTAMFVFGLWRVETTARRAEETAERVEQINDARRATARGLLYGGCQSINELRVALDESFQLLAVLALQGPTANPDRISRALDALRGQLNLSDCGHVFDGLTAEEAEAARAVAGSVPTLPLPAPTVPGYVPDDAPLD